MGVRLETFAMTHKQIIVTAEDYQQLKNLLASNVVRLVNRSNGLNELRGELDSAQIVPRDQVPSDVVTMNSTVSLRDLATDEVETYTLVYPERADIANSKLSVLAPIGTAILGYRVGDKFRWRVPEGWRSLKIEVVIYHPERDGEICGSGGGRGKPLGAPVSGPRILNYELRPPLSLQ